MGKVERDQKMHVRMHAAHPRWGEAMQLRIAPADQVSNNSHQIYTLWKPAINKRHGTLGYLTTFMWPTSDPLVTPEAQDHPVGKRQDRAAIGDRPLVQVALEVR